MHVNDVNRYNWRETMSDDEDAQYDEPRNIVQAWEKCVADEWETTLRISTGLMAKKPGFEILHVFVDDTEQEQFPTEIALTIDQDINKKLVKQFLKLLKVCDDRSIERIQVQNSDEDHDDSSPLRSLANMMTLTVEFDNPEPPLVLKELSKASFIRQLDLEGKYLPFLRHILEPPSNISSVSLRRDDETFDCGMLAEALSTAVSLEFLELHNFHFDQHELDSICSSLTPCSQLKRIYMSNTMAVGVESVNPIEKILDEHSLLEDFAVVGDEISWPPGGLRGLSEPVMNQKTLKTLTLSVSPQQVPETLHLMNAFSSCPLKKMKIESRGRDFQLLQMEKAEDGSSKILFLPVGRNEHQENCLRMFQRVQNVSQLHIDAVHDMSFLMDLMHDVVGNPDCKLTHLIFQLRQTGGDTRVPRTSSLLRFLANLEHCTCLSSLSIPLCSLPQIPPFCPKSQLVTCTLQICSTDQSSLFRACSNLLDEQGALQELVILAPMDLTLCDSGEPYFTTFLDSLIGHSSLKSLRFGETYFGPDSIVLETRFLQALVDAVNQNKRLTTIDFYSTTAPGLVTLIDKIKNLQVLEVPQRFERNDPLFAQTLLKNLSITSIVKKTDDEPVPETVRCILRRNNLLLHVSKMADGTSSLKIDCYTLWARILYRMVSSKEVGGTPIFAFLVAGADWF